MRAPNLPPTANPSSVETLIPRFLSKVMFGDDCWEWVGSIAPGGYGRININATGGYVLAHRLSFELFVDEIPDGLTIDHLCRNRSCVNPKHLEVVTSRENTLRGTSFSAVNAAKTHCEKGHPLEGDNLFWFANGQKRGCVECRKVRVRGYWRKMTPEQRERRRQRRRALAESRR